ncbi:hypothetical protein BCR36DRAFT_408100 [Piromyces finnis]|uniref:Uncharacterized protein n=1 Tax=Piromyces finnis TaxID=1754191 RepID=A0A1Y1VNZ8_9FUNG|nr:hypothetical protein BCR36DRAFT_408100 [Piromyces finnis]|eukprot:ORX61124.1 hypothetical protein BCR36DRAFT_408100 [Piromyces finnis]
MNSNILKTYENKENIRKYHRINITQSELQELIEKTKLKQVNNKKENAEKKKNLNIKKKNENNKTKLTEKKNNTNLLNQKIITKKMKPKNLKYSILTEKPLVLLRNTNIKFNNKKESEKNQAYNENSQINIDNNLINKYVKKGNFSMKYSTNRLKNDKDSSFEIYPNSINENNLSPIKPTNQINILGKTKIIESKIIPLEINNKLPLTSNSKNNNIFNEVEKEFNYGKMHINTKCEVFTNNKTVDSFEPRNNNFDKNIFQCVTNNGVKNNDEIKTFIINSEVEDPFLIIPSNSSSRWIDFQPILSKEEEELSITEEDDEILI